MFHTVPTHWGDPLQLSQNLWAHRPIHLHFLAGVGVWGGDGKCGDFGTPFVQAASGHTKLFGQPINALAILHAPHGIVLKLSGISLSPLHSLLPLPESVPIPIVSIQGVSPGLGFVPMPIVESSSDFDSAFGVSQNISFSLKIAKNPVIAQPSLCSVIPSSKTPDGVQIFKCVA